MKYNGQTLECSLEEFVNTFCKHKLHMPTHEDIKKNKFIVSFERDFAHVNEQIEFHFKEWKLQHPAWDAVHDDYQPMWEYLLKSMRGFEYYLWRDDIGRKIIHFDEVEQKVDEFVRNLL